MILEELLRRLSLGPLSNTAVGGSGSGEIPAAKVPQVVTYVNEGLRALYSRFPIKEASIAVRLSAGKNRYPLLTTNAYSVNPEGFILDTEARPYKGDLIKVLAAADGSGNDLPLNDRDSSMAVFTPEPTTIMVPHPIDNQVIYLVYQALPDEIFDNEAEQGIPITRLLEDALVAYIAHCAYRDMNTETSMLTAQQHLARYEMICGKNTENDLVNSQTHGGGQKFHERGFL